MADGTVNSNALYLEKMEALTDAISNLTTYVKQGADQAAQDRVQGANAAGVAAASGSSYALPGAVVPAAGGGWSSASASASTPDKLVASSAQQTAQSQLGEINSQSNQGASGPPDGTVPPPPSYGTTPGTSGGSSSGGVSGGNEQEQQAIQALTWQELGQIGGPLGALKTRSYAIQRNLQFAGGLSNGLANKLPGTNAGLSKVGNALNWAGSGTSTSAQTLQAGIVGANATIQAMSGWRDMGLQLGYGTQGSQGNAFLGINNPFAQTGATGQGAALKVEEQGLRGRWPGSFGTGLTADQANAAVDVLAGQGFSDNGYSKTTSSGKPMWSMGGMLHGPDGSTTTSVNGDNYNIAKNLMQPMMAQGMDATDIAQWTPALRNAGTSIDSLATSLEQIPNAARGAKMTIDEYNASLLQTAQTEEAMGGTQYGGLQAGLQFGQMTQGMAPGIMGQLIQNPMVQALAIGQNGVLPSGVANLTGGAQNQAVMSTINMLGSAFQNLNRNKYTNIPGVGRVMTQSGTLNEAAQVGQLLGITTQQAERMLKQAGSETQISHLQTELGQEGSGGRWGTKSTGIYNFLGDGKASDWSHLSAYDRQTATKYWNATGGKQVQSLAQQGLITPSQLKSIDSTHNISQRMADLNHALASPSQQAAGQQISVKLGLTPAASRLVKQIGPSSTTLKQNSGGAPGNATANSPFGEAVAANQGGYFSFGGDSEAIGSGAQAGSP